VVEGQNGFTFARDSDRELAGAIERYFGSELYDGLEGHRKEIRERAAEDHSWSKVARMTMEIYRQTGGRSTIEAVPERLPVAGPGAGSSE
jgi:glycosyltransferase involved in cell wall biosynthesis